MSTATLTRMINVPVSAYRLAERVAARLDALEPVVVDVAGYGKGWYVTGVDWERGLFEVWRGERVSVSWLAVLG